MPLSSKSLATAGALCLAGLPGVALAGTATSTGTATFDVVDQCTVAGATVNLGTYNSSSTIADLAADLGDWQSTYTPGIRGQAYLNWGTVNCTSGMPYTLSIKGTSVEVLSLGGVRFAWSDAQNNNYSAIFDPYVKSIGGVIVADTNANAPGAGAKVNTGFASGIGTGLPQIVQGSVAYNYNASMSQYFDKLVAGSQSDTLTYTLNF